jgi:hypothetical protein
MRPIEVDAVARAISDGLAFAAKVAGEMALHVLAYNLTRVMNIVGIKPLMASIAA